MIWLLSHPLPPSPVSNLDCIATHRKNEKERQFVDGRGEGGERGAAESFKLYKSFNTLWFSGLIVSLLECISWGGGGGDVKPDTLPLNQNKKFKTRIY
jgi:hypothetical protein